MPNPLNTAWVFWAHLATDNNWGLDSYVSIMEAGLAEEVAALVAATTEGMATSSMLFFMRKNVSPLWEENKNGGCFSYKVSNATALNTWNDMVMLCTGESLSTDAAFNQAVDGVSISPKKGFCILKIWMRTLQYKDAKKIEGLKTLGCLFKPNSER
jgi:hypothetical protein